MHGVSCPPREGRDADRLRAEFERLEHDGFLLLQRSVDPELTAWKHEFGASTQARGAPGDDLELAVLVRTTSQLSDHVRRDAQSGQVLFQPCGQPIRVTRSEQRQAGLADEADSEA